MRLYLSSFRLGNQPGVMVDMLKGKKRAAVIMNAGDHATPERRAASLDLECDLLRGLALEPEEVDLRDYFGKQDSLRERLAQFDLLWVRGGNCFILRRAFHQSGADEIVQDLLQRDAIVYAGYSAGIDMLVTSMRGFENVDDPYLIPEGYESEIIWDGLGILPYAVAPHYRSDHPESAAVEESVQYLIDNHILFKALRDGQAIVVDGDREYVVG